MNHVDNANVLVQIKNLKKHFPVRRAFFSGVKPSEEFVHAVDGISFDIHDREAISIVGESGCGKTTLARLILRLMEPTEGTITFDSQDLFAATKKEMRKVRVQMQAVFQDPYASLDPKKTILQIVSEPLSVNHVTKRGRETFERVNAALTAVGFTSPQRFLAKFPYELSGGQRQRVAMARAMAVNPRLIIADEPVSMLDASIRAEILNLMLNLQQEFNLTYVFITHDLAVARYVSDRMAVMYLGRIVEIGPAEDVCTKPAHPYTKALLSALPTTNPQQRHEGVEVKGEVPSAVKIPSGCRFRPRCLYAFDKCEVEPEMIKVGEGHYAACWLVEKP
jgi:peptide/nickel transport system ATP-binding protein